MPDLESDSKYAIIRIDKRITAAIVTNICGYIGDVIVLKRQISIGGAPAVTVRAMWGCRSGALPIESFEVSRWRSARRALPMGILSRCLIEETVPDEPDLIARSTGL